MNFWKKRINNKYQVAKDLGISEEKVNELIEGKREIGGDTMDKVLKSIENEKENKIIKRADIIKWYKETDLKQLRLSFGYERQQDLADVIGCDGSTISNIEAKKVSNTSRVLARLYDFYNNDFNKEIEKEEKIVETEKAEEPVKQETAGLLIKVAKDGTIRVFEDGNEVNYITKLYLEAVAGEKPIITIEKRYF